MSWGFQQNAEGEWMPFDDEIDHQSIASQFEWKLIEAHTLLEEIVQHAKQGSPPWYVIPDHLIERAKRIVSGQHSSDTPP